MASVVIRSILGPSVSIASWSRVPTIASSRYAPFSTSISRNTESGPSTSSTATPSSAPASPSPPVTGAATVNSPSARAPSNAAIPPTAAAAEAQAKPTPQAATATLRATPPSASSAPIPAPPRRSSGNNKAFRWAPEASTDEKSSVASQYEGPRLSPIPSTERSGADTSPTHTLTVVSTRNNVLLTFADARGPLFPTITGGTDKAFKKSGRASFEAAYQATTKMIAKILDWSADRPRQQPFFIRLALKGMNGQGREAVTSALMGPEGQEIRKEFKRIEDRTPVKIGGTRARKARRL